MKNIIQLIDNYRKSEAGHIAVIFALVAMPLLIATSFAIDFSAAEKTRVNIANALDDAALAAILDQSLTEAERETYASDFFWAFFDPQANIDFTVEDSSAERVALKAHAIVPTTISAAMGYKEINVVETAVSELTKGDVICMLTLDPENKESFKITGGGVLVAKNCSVQVNSIHKTGSVVNQGGVAMAKDFCMAGGANGLYTPYANTDCAPIADPFKHRKIPAPGACMEQSKVDEKMNDWRSSAFVDALGNALAPQISLDPGTYCGGLNISGKNIALSPGEYIFTDGPLLIGNGSRIDAEGVTLILAGKEAYFNIGGSGLMNFTAPKTGALAGLVFAQYLEKELGPPDPLPHAKSVISNGSQLSIIGTAYMPTQKITFMGGSLSIAQAPATSFIAYQLEITGGANIAVAVDHQAAGLPPLLPRSDEGARLVE